MTADDIDERRLARSIGTENTEDLSPPNGEVDTFERAHALERLAQTANLEQRIVAVRRRDVCWRYRYAGCVTRSDRLRVRAFILRNVCARCKRSSNVIAARMS